MKNKNEKSGKDKIPSKLKTYIILLINLLIIIQVNYGAIYRTFAAWGDVGSNDNWPGPTLH